MIQIKLDSIKLLWLYDSLKSRCRVPESKSTCQYTSRLANDKAVFLVLQAFEIRYEVEKFISVPRQAVLIFERDEKLRCYYIFYAEKIDSMN
jgi:hypothetical protein